jgi:hypothetical protein
MADGSPPASADAGALARYDLQLRLRFDGNLVGAPFEQRSPMPPFLDAVDGVYLLFEEPLTSRSDAAPAEMEAEAARLLDTVALPLKTRLNKPLIIAPAYASADGAATACLPDPQGGCLPLDALQQPNPIPGDLLRPAGAGYLLCSAGSRQCQDLIDGSSAAATTPGSAAG